MAAGCGGGSSGGTPVAAPSTVPPVSHSASPTPTQSTVTAKPTNTVTSTVTPTQTASPCLTSNLSLSVGQSQGAAGTFFSPVLLTNVGSHPCTLFGYPGVSFVDSSGAQLGLPASHDKGKARTVLLSPQGTAGALLRQPDPGVYPPSRCQPATSAKLKVYPPGQRDPLLVNDARQICTTKTGRAGIGVTESGTNPH